MEDWKTNKLGELLTQRKEQIVIQPGSEYSLVTITNKGEVRLREKKKGALIKSQKGYVTKAGDFIYSRLSVHNGAFGIVPEELEDALITNEMPSFQIDTTQIHPKILLDLLGMPEFQWKLNQLTKGMGRVRIKESMMLDLNVSFPVPSKQQLFVDKIDTVKNHRFELSSELTHQQTLLKKLRQQILQEAIEGKLTAQWRKENPDTESASVLLEKIKAEKAQLVKEKKIKKQKALPLVTEEEKPFELPGGWEWCRLGDIMYFITDGTHHTPTYTQMGIPFLSVKDVAHGFIDFSNTKYISVDEHQTLIKRCHPKTGDILLTKVGTTGIAKVVDVEKEFSIFVSVALLKFNRQYLFNYYLENLINSPLVRMQSKSGTKGMGNQNLVIRAINNFIIPLPPLPEQKAIVVKVEKLLALCDQLETRITRNQGHADQLMQAVLQEAFDPDGQEPGRKQPLQSKEV